MDAELAALAAAGATALVQQMVTDGWGNVRDRVVVFFSRGREEDAVQGELEASRADLVAARDAGDEEAADDVRASWRVRLRRTLRDDPAAAAELRALLDELAPPPTGPAMVTVHNTINDGTHHGVIQVGLVYGSSTVGETGTGEYQRRE
ncbi:hypothetical protein ACFFS2_07420 [Streptomyces aurantiacus]|uniref:Uncharacterized protein n=1 Tax=Streptomyces aurantiacus TaxID=47760 RepID=A0A7G1P8K4_9ACTN|nr:hypothetical protein [Streptomyces aurantiacus]BCL31382.1 hypothetical protein GCM10017557_62410 [Streptomyces aurantiacus]